MSKRILNIVPVPVPPAALEAFAAQLPAEAVHADFENVFVAAAAGARIIDSPYEQLLAEAFVLEAGCRAEEDGFAAVCVNSMSDSAEPSPSTSRKGATMACSRSRACRTGCGW